MIEKLKDVISRHADFSEEEWNEILPHFTPLIVPKNTVLIHLDQVATDMYFIHKGAIRSYYLHNVEEVNDGFFFEENFATSLSSFLHRKPSKLVLETMEASELLCFNIDAYNKLNNTVNKINALTRYITERALIGVHNNYCLSQINPKKRVNKILREQPELIGRVPQQYIASYLKIPLLHYSRFIEDIRKNN